MTAADITRKLQEWRDGDRSAVDELMPFLLAHMRGIARRMYKPGETLNTTALVNEAWLRLEGSDVELADREHFLALIARAMRQILIDHARAQQRVKRGGGAQRVTLSDDVTLTDQQIEWLLVINDLLERLDKAHPRRRRIFEMRFFAGLTVEEIAGALNVAENTVIRDYRLACAWLRFHFESAGATTGLPV